MKQWTACFPATLKKQLWLKEKLSIIKRKRKKIRLRFALIRKGVLLNGAMTYGDLTDHPRHSSEQYKKGYLSTYKYNFFMFESFVHLYAKNNLPNYGRWTARESFGWVYYNYETRRVGFFAYLRGGGGVCRTCQADLYWGRRRPIYDLAFGSVIKQLKGIQKQSPMKHVFFFFLFSP